MQITQVRLKFTWISLLSSFLIFGQTTLFLCTLRVFRDTHLYMHDTWNIISTYLCTKHIHQIHTSITRFKQVNFHRHSQTDVLRLTFSDRRSQIDVLKTDVLRLTFSDRRSYIFRPMLCKRSLSIFFDRRCCFFVPCAVQCLSHFCNVWRNKPSETPIIHPKFASHVCS